MIRLLLVRHGQSEGNAEKRLQGQADINLSDTGIEQAGILGPVVQKIKPDYVICSDLKRAKSTAGIIGFSKAELSSELREISVGDWTGLRISEIIETDSNDYYNWRAGRYTPPNGESWERFVERTSSFVDKFRRSEGIQNLLVVCHGGVIRALLDHYLKLEPKSIIPVAPASLTCIRLGTNDDTPARLELFNYRPNDLEFGAPD